VQKFFCSSGLKAEEHRKVSIGEGRLKIQKCTCYLAGSDGAAAQKTLKKPPSTSTRRVQGGPQAGDGELDFWFDLHPITDSCDRLFYRSNHDSW
jgi:hypothetical protein